MPTTRPPTHCRALLDRWERSEDHHYAVKGLRWGAAFFARRGDLAGAHACSEALARIAVDDRAARRPWPRWLTPSARRRSPNGDAETAAEQLRQAVELHRGLDVPFERAEIELRAGVILAAAGEREPALERLGDAYRGARKLGARPLAAEAAREVAALGESVARRLGSRAAADADGAGLSRRELEVVRLVAVGRTNREIAQELFLSPRTVDMHVRNILRKLDCRSRARPPTGPGSWACWSSGPGRARPRRSPSTPARRTRRTIRVALKRGPSVLSEARMRADPGGRQPVVAALVERRHDLVLEHAVQLAGVARVGGAVVVVDLAGDRPAVRRRRRPPPTSRRARSAGARRSSPTSSRWSRSPRAAGAGRSARRRSRARARRREPRS